MFKGKNWSELSPDDKNAVIDTYASETYPGNIGLATFIKDGIADKSITYRNIKWSKEYGRIQSVSRLEVDKDTGNAHMNPMPATVKNNTIDKNIGKIHEEILYCILVFSFGIEKCIERIKKIFNIQKMSVSSVNKFTKFYDECKLVIEENPFNE